VVALRLQATLKAQGARSQATDFVPFSSIEPLGNSTNPNSRFRIGGLKKPGDGFLDVPQSQRVMLPGTAAKPSTV
jgi:hypothetical protein